MAATAEPMKATLEEAAREAAALATDLGREPVLVGALALSFHGYSRETSDVDIAMAITSDTDLDLILEAAKRRGLHAKAKHQFGGFDFRTKSGARIDVITLRGELVELTADAAAEAQRSKRVWGVFGQQMLVASIGHLIALKLIGERQKDKADIVELLKARIEDGRWSSDYGQASDVLKRYLGRYAVSVLDRYVLVARQELGTDAGQ